MLIAIVIDIVNRSAVAGFLGVGLETFFGPVAFTPGGGAAGGVSEGFGGGFCDSFESCGFAERDEVGHLADKFNPGPIHKFTASAQEGGGYASTAIARIEHDAADRCEIAVDPLGEGFVEFSADSKQAIPQ